MTAHLMMSAEEALERLILGNRRFAGELFGDHGIRGQARRSELRQSQAPFAIILGCSDSRVPAEIIFDQGLGDLFVIRVAGNIVAPSQVGSVEFAAERFGTPLVVVLGHSRCGAVLATIEELEQPGSDRSPNLARIVDFIRPAVQPLYEAGTGWERDELIHHSVRANIRASAGHLRHGSPILERLTQEHGLLVVGAEYSLDDGTVDFFDGVPDELINR